MAFDDLLGLMNTRLGQPGMTGTLSVKYRRPTPLYRELRMEAWIGKIEGRRVLAHGTLLDGDDLCAEAEGLFVALRPAAAEALTAGRDRA